MPSLRLPRRAPPRGLSGLAVPGDEAACWGEGLPEANFSPRTARRRRISRSSGQLRLPVSLPAQPSDPYSRNVEALADLLSARLGPAVQLESLPT